MEEQSIHAAFCRLYYKLKHHGAPIFTQKVEILQGSMDADRVCTRMKQAEQAIEGTASTITEWNENAVRQIVERVTVLSADEVLVRIKGGAEIKQAINK